MAQGKKTGVLLLNLGGPADRILAALALNA